MRKHPLANCLECPYLETGQFVPTQFPTKPIKLAVVGEAPGSQEARTGIPFTGPSGELLNNVLNYHGIKRDEVLLTNACLCRPFGPTEAPPKSALAACSNRLHSEIKESKATTILAVGGTAAKAVVDDNRTITRLRVGPAKQYREDDKVKVVPTFHPAYCLRSPDSFPSFISDVGKIKGSYGNWAAPEYKVFDDPSVAREALRRLGQRTEPITLDIEAGTEKDLDYTHPEEFDLLCVGIGYARRKTVVLGYTAVHDKGVIDLLREYLSRTRIIAHNGKFDLRALSPHVGVQTLWFDTMLASYALDERPGGHGLKTLSIERLGAPQYDLEIKKYIPRGGNYADIPRDVLYKYNAMDVACTWDLYELFISEMTEDQRRAHDFMVAGSNALIHLELAGITFDEQYNKELDEEYATRIGTIEDEICETIGRKINPRSVQQVTAYLLENGLRVSTTNKDYLKELRPKLKGETGEFIDLLLHHRKESKIYGTYIKGLAKKTTYGKVYTTYLLHGTTSGRLASRNPNQQNIIRSAKIRNQFTVESPDNVLVQFDYKQAEGRVIATLAKDEYLRGIFSDHSRDIFDELCNDVFGMGKWKKEQRVTMKSIFYGNAFGREALSISRALKLDHGLDISVEETSIMMREFNALIPGVVEWQNKIKQKVLNGEDLVTPFGRKRSFYLITNDNKKDVINEALSFLPQSIASDICLSALIHLQPLLDSIATIRLSIHDALVLECHKDDIEKVCTIACREMIEAGKRFTEYVPFVVDVSTGTRLGEFK